MKPTYEELDDLCEKMIEFTAYKKGHHSVQVHGLLTFVHEDFIVVKTKDDTLYVNRRDIEDLREMTISDIEKYGKVDDE